MTVEAVVRAEAGTGQAGRGVGAREAAGWEGTAVRGAGAGVQAVSGR